MKITVSERIDELGLQLTDGQRRQVGKMAVSGYNAKFGVSPPFEEGVHQYRHTEGHLTIIDLAIDFEVSISGTAEQKERLAKAKERGLI